TSSSDALSTRPTRLKKRLGAGLTQRARCPLLFARNSHFWVTYRFPRVLFGAAAGPASASSDCPADASRDVETYYFPAGAISLERALTELSARRTTYSARECCRTPTRPIPASPRSAARPRAY